MMLWDLFQQIQISNSSKSANDASLKASIAQVQAEQLEDQLQTLALASQAMWELLSTHFGMTEDDLLKKISEIDLRDGVLDGKLNISARKTCPDCNKEVKRIRANCYWCGAKLSQTTPFIK